MSLIFAKINRKTIGLCFLTLVYKQFSSEKNNGKNESLVVGQGSRKRGLRKKRENKALQYFFCFHEQKKSRFLTSIFEVEEVFGFMNGA